MPTAVHEQQLIQTQQDQPPKPLANSVAENSTLQEGGGQELGSDDAVVDGEEDIIDNGNTRYQLDVGDHIYSWRGAGAWSHHGIVISVTKVSVAILDFFPERQKKKKQQQQNNNSQDGRNNDSSSILRVLSLEEWKATYGNPYKVTYNAGYLRRTFCRSGTCTSCESAPTFLVVARIQFLLSSEDLVLPTYHSLYSNSETAAFWCKTGYWSTLQVADFLHLTFAGQLKSSVTLGAYVSTQTVTVPAAGIWGYLGFTTKVTLASTQPLLLPLIAGYGLVTAGSPLYMLYQCRSQWHNTTKHMHEEFWSAAPNDLIVQCILFWCKSGE